jgi:hypothetical protein
MRTHRKLRMEEHSRNVERECTTYVAGVFFLEQDVCKNACCAFKLHFSSVDFFKRKTLSYEVFD